ncbi:MAG: MFS transporter [Eubacteriales bacterium]|nr:MFS transporter [Eubacteriales bacterium]
MNFMTKLFSKKIFNSKIESVNTQKSEMWLGYFLGPCMVYMVYYAVAGTYLTQFYTDVLGMSGIILTMMPVFSKIVDALTNIMMGRLIDKTRTVQGKVRPWILVSGVFMAIAGVLLYAIPNWSTGVRIVWIVVSYNLFFAFAFTLYNISHALMVPLSTRNTKQRDGLAMLTSTGTTMIPGLMVSLILPVMINAIGVGSASQSRWILIMGILSMLAIPGTLIEYYFSKERVTIDNANKMTDGEAQTITFKQQWKACFSDKYWIQIMLLFGTYQLLTFLSTNSVLYYCNWVLGTSVQQGTGMQVLVNAIGQAPLGFGIFVLWPLVRKFGKRRVMQIGFLIGAAGSAIVLFCGSNLGIVLVGLFIKSIGALPSYVIAAQLAESLDHVEWKYGFRADGFSASAQSILITVMSGVSQTLILCGITSFGYIAPTSKVQEIIQPDGMKLFFTCAFVGAPMFGYLIGSLIMHFYDVESKMPQITADILERHKAVAAARGEVYISPEEAAAIEQKKIENEMEIKRVEELKAKCAKKGLDFDVEEAKYQKKRAELTAKEEMKKAKKRK